MCVDLHELVLFTCATARQGKIKTGLVGVRWPPVVAEAGAALIKVGKSGCREQTESNILLPLSVLPVCCPFVMSMWDGWMGRILCFKD